MGPLDIRCSASQLTGLLAATVFRGRVNEPGKVVKTPHIFLVYTGEKKTMLSNQEITHLQGNLKN